jgi:hypothetical protein
MVCFTPRPPYPRDTHRYSLYRRLGGWQSQSGHSSYEKNVLPLPGTEARRSSTLHSHCIELSRIWLWYLSMSHGLTLQQASLCSTDWQTCFETSRVLPSSRRVVTINNNRNAYSLEYNNNPEAFFTPHRADHGCISAVFRRLFYPRHTLICQRHVTAHHRISPHEMGGTKLYMVINM